VSIEGLDGEALAVLIESIGPAIESAVRDGALVSVAADFIAPGSKDSYNDRRVEMESVAKSKRTIRTLVAQAKSAPR